MACENGDKAAKAEEDERLGGENEMKKMWKSMALKAGNGS